MKIYKEQNGYYYCTDNREILIKTIKEELNIGYIVDGIFFINRDYRNRFNKVKKQVIKDFGVELLSEYVDMRG